MTKPPVKTPRKPKQPKVSKAVKKYVKNAIVHNPEIETKYATAGQPYTNFNSFISNTAEMYAVIPKINQGSKAYERQGLKIEPVSCILDFQVGLADQARSGALIYDIYVLESVKFRDINEFIYAGDVKFLATGDSTECKQYAGDSQDGMMPVYKPTFKLVKHIRGVIAKNVGDQNNDTTAGNSPNLGKGGVGLHRIKVPMPKTLKYDNETTGAWPTNKCLMWCIGYTHVDGSTPDYVNQDLTVTVRNHFWYKDA